MRALVFLFFLGNAVSPCKASDMGRVDILSPEQVEASLDAFSIVDARDRERFRMGHIPSSVHTTWEDWVRERPGLWNLWFGNPARWGMVPEPDAGLENRLRRLGLSNARPILVVGDPSGWGEEGRIAWNLLYWGAERVALLDGGFSAWLRAYPGKQEMGDGAPPAPGTFTVRVRPDRRIERQALASGLKQHTLLDARTPEEYAGKKVRGQKRGGHLPGAHLVPLRSLYDVQGRYVSAETLRKLVPPLKPSPVAYCVGGVRSALLALLVEARLGIPVRNYEGSIWDWAAHPELPMK